MPASGTPPFPIYLDSQRKIRDTHVTYIILKKMGYSVKSVSSGEEAVDYMKNK